MSASVRYSLILLAGLAIGYCLGRAVTTERIAPPTETSPSISTSPPAATTHTPVALEIGKKPKAEALPTSETAVNTTGKDLLAEVAQQDGREYTEQVDDAQWRQFLQQHYPESTYQILQWQPAATKQLIRAFQQSEIDHHWATLTEHRLRDFYLTNENQHLIQLDKVHCRQNGCEITGLYLKDGLEMQLNIELRKQAWARGRSFSFSTKSEDGNSNKFYLLMQEMPKE
ncbi:hypothetical protein A5320_18805 [Rheinheimera sp. SA_1]|uniref:hypothetical protein n=1 Tax=Rheinheimera sp. SA_1 TaxID=1827365 RepID=UPI00080057EF|nr:hypothetical protein [Rheinheimera sp. SA_1]OBP13363.1 hypothetical protein A5320_18805 [Rheinheimera sp. SA_1]